MCRCIMRRVVLINSMIVIISGILFVLCVVRIICMIMSRRIIRIRICRLRVMFRLRRRSPLSLSSRVVIMCFCVL